ncbi:kptA [Symbiodinium sp. CCMP2592]|nr:kptA [Symbiodinium sp. CCMP2592]
MLFALSSLFAKTEAAYVQHVPFAAAQEVASSQEVPSSPGSMSLLEVLVTLAMVCMAAWFVNYDVDSFNEEKKEVTERAEKLKKVEESLEKEKEEFEDRKTEFEETVKRFLKKQKEVKEKEDKVTEREEKVEKGQETLQEQAKALSEKETALEEAEENVKGREAEVERKKKEEREEYAKKYVDDAKKDLERELKLLKQEEKVTNQKLDDLQYDYKSLKDDYQYFKSYSKEVDALLLAAKDKIVKYKKKVKSLKETIGDDATVDPEIAEFTQLGYVWEFNKKTQEYRVKCEDKKGSQRIKNAPVKGRLLWNKVTECYRKHNVWFVDGRELDKYLEGKENEKIEEEVQRRIGMKGKNDNTGTKGKGPSWDDGQNDSWWYGEQWNNENWNTTDDGSGWCENANPHNKGYWQTPEEWAQQNQWDQWTPKGKSKGKKSKNWTQTQAIRRAKHRAQTQGFTWYKGRRITAPQIADVALRTAGRPATESHATRGNRAGQHHVERLSILSLNVGSLSTLLWQELKEYLATAQADVICLQETHWSTTSDFMVQGWRAIHSGTKARADGILTLVHPRHNKHVVRHEEIVPGRARRVQLQAPHGRIEIHNCYQHPHNYTESLKKKRHAFLNKVTRSITGIPLRTTLIVAGDFQAEVKPSPPHVGRSTRNTPFHVGPEATDPDALARMGWWR